MNDGAEAGEGLAEREINVAGALAIVGESWERGLVDVACRKQLFEIHEIAVALHFLNDPAHDRLVGFEVNLCVLGEGLGDAARNCESEQNAAAADGERLGHRGAPFGW